MRAFIGGQICGARGFSPFGYCVVQQVGLIPPEAENRTTRALPNPNNSTLIGSWCRRHCAQALGIGNKSYLPRVLVRARTRPLGLHGSQATPERPLVTAV